MNRNDQQGLEEAIAYFRHSVELSPTFAPASEGLAEGLRDMVDQDYVAADVGWEQARKGAEV